ncbi:MAG: GntR family transcriptional regulator [Acidimicrobiales bacterium]
MTESIAASDPLAILQPASGGRQTAHVYVRETVRGAILNGQLAGGTRLLQSELAAQLEVSTTPVREALRDLASDGLIRIDPHHGGVVSEFDGDDLREVYQIRQRIEPLALELAMPLITDEILDRCEELHDAMSAAPSSAAWVQLNREFHMTIYEASNQHRLVTMVRSLQDASVMAVSARVQGLPQARDAANKEHADLIEALRAGDLEGATAVMLHHLTMSIRPEETAAG